MLQSNNKYICVIGAANIDMVGFPKHKLIFKDSNDGTLKISVGGVGRNIAENLARLGLPTKLITAIGDDIYGNKIVDSCNKTGIDISSSLFVKEQPSSIHLAIMDHKNDMALGFSAMDVCKKLDTKFIAEKKELIKNAHAVILETNIPKNTLSKIVEDQPDQTYLLDTVSGKKSLRAKNILSNLFILKTNKIESEKLSGIKISDLKSLEKSAFYFHKKGVKNIFITLGEDGIYYSNGIESKFISPKNTKAINTIGAGDAFTAGVIFGYLNSMDINQWAKFGMACAELTIASEESVSPEINRDLILEMVNDD